MPFFNVCSYQERYFYEGWQRETGLTAYEMCQVLEKQREDDEHRAWEDHLWDVEQSNRAEQKDIEAHEAELIAAKTAGMTEEQRAAYLIEHEAAKAGAVDGRKTGLFTGALTRFTELIERGEHRGYFEEDELAVYDAKPMSDEELEAAAEVFLKTNAEAQAALEQLYNDLYVGPGRYWAAEERIRVAGHLFSLFSRALGTKILPKA